MNKMSMNEVFGAVATERAYQEDKWDSPESSVIEYLVYMKHHIDKALEVISTDECIDVCDSVLSQIRKITALGVACGEQHGMYKRAGFEDRFLFNTNDFITVEFQGNQLVQCIESGDNLAVFGKVEHSNGQLFTSHSSTFCVPNQHFDAFKYKRVSKEEVKLLVESYAKNGGEESPVQPEEVSDNL
jgi:hypothetical protein